MLTMDLSNSEPLKNVSLAELINGTARIGMDSLSALDQLSLVLYYADRCKGFLKHYPGFTEIQRLLNYDGVDDITDERKTPSEVISLAEGLTLTTRIVSLAELKDFSTGSLTAQPGFVRERSIIFTQNARFLLWDLHYLQRKRGVQDVTHCHFEWLTEERLMAAISEGTFKPREFLFILWAKTGQVLENLKTKLHGVSLIDAELRHVTSMIPY
jgi:hypothetical protein